MRWCLPSLVLSAVVAIAMAGYAVYCAASARGPSADGRGTHTKRRNNGGAAEKGQLSIELRLEKEEYDTSESVDVTVIFHNTGKFTIQFPLGRGVVNRLLFDFLFVGTYGHDYLTKSFRGGTSCTLGSSLEGVYLVSLPPGKTHAVPLRNVVPLRATGAGVLRGERYRMVAIYRTYSLASHAKPGMKVWDVTKLWRGMALSKPVSINRIEMDPNHPYLDPNFPILLDANDPRLKGDRREPSREQRKKRTETQGVRE